MATRLSHCDVDACSSALRELYAETSLPALAEKTLAVVSGLVACDVMSYDDWQLDGLGRPTAYRGLRRPFVAEVDNFSPVVAACIHDHPLFPEVMLKHAPTPVKISDFATKTQLHRTGIYNEVYRHLGIDSQIICTLSWLPHSRNYLVLNRDGKDFSERDRNVLAFLAPHIAQAHRNACIADGMAFNLNMLGQGLDAMRRAVILAGADGWIHWQSAQSREWLREFFPEAKPGRLPPRLGKLLQRTEASSPAGRPVFAEFQTSTQDGCRLLVYCGNLIPAGRCWH